MRFLVIGCGSIGRRHIKNLSILGVKKEDILAYDTDPSVGLEYVTQVGNWTTHLDDVDAVLVCTPPDSHLYYAGTAIDAGKHVFIEKPLSYPASKGVISEWIDLNKKAKSSNLVAQVGHNLRYDRGLELIKSMIESGDLEPVSAYAEFGFALPKWRPGTDHTKSYTSQIGIIYDASHEIDYMRWLLGWAQRIWVVSNTSNIYSTCDSSDLLIMTEKYISYHLHLDMLQPQYSRFCRIIGVGKTVEWHFQRAYLEISEPMRVDIVYYDTVDTYIEELKDFIYCIEKKDMPEVTLLDGIQVLDTIRLGLNL